MVKSLKSKKKKLAPTLFYYVTREILLGNSKNVICIEQSRFQPRSQSNFKKIALALHDFAGNFYLIGFANCETIEINLCNAVNFP